MQKRSNTSPIMAAILLAGMATAVTIAPAAADAPEPRTVVITVTDKGYEPTSVELAAEPARLAFTNQADMACAASVKSEALGIEMTELPKGETTVVEVKPEKAGAYTFTCGMGMMKGTIVVEAPGFSS